MRLPGMRKIALLLAVLVMAGGCGNVEVSARTPGFLPVSASVTLSEHKVEFKGDLSYVTPLGEVSIGLKIGEDVEQDVVRVRFRDRDRLGGSDQVFDLRTGGDEFEAVLEGKPSVRVKDHEITLDITDAAVTEIRFRQTEESVRAERGWWANAFYHPFDLFRWAYDDSTMASWPPLGFLWFLLRLIFAVVLAVVDVYLSAVFVLGWLAALLFGNSAGNAVVGIAVLATIAVVVAAVVVRRRAAADAAMREFRRWYGPGL
ncbi:hypothetical protein [Actinokineospora globicatena]|uniref:Transmembrane protein n=1 Tax=Actinokineospora globicatena TaxID=103729 RepID=A0A9W6V9E3_9PSEU|nr:hypothetical protein [Actinokineospora globicatena]GLW90888.1 hypothetical protein Aglo03_17040 [Actinokineospora globicatena]